MRVVASSQEFDALQAQWTVLHAVAGLAAFQSFQWMRAWWHHFGTSPRYALQLLVAQAGERIVAIFPCMVERVRIAGILPLRKLVPLGRGVSDYLDMIVLPEYRDAACEAFARAIKEQIQCEEVRFSEVPDGSPLHRVLELLHASGFDTTRTVREQCPRTLLLSSWEETLAGFTKNQRKSLSYIERRLEKTFQVQFRRVGPGDDLAAELDRFMDMHQRRWQAVGQPGAFADSVTRRFHLDVAREFHAQGWLVLAFLMLEGQPAASMYGFKVGGQLQFYLSGTGGEDSFRKYSPGVALHVYCMQQMIAEGVAMYDFLRGTEQYKYDLGAADVPLWSFRAVRGTARATLLSRLYDAYVRLGDGVKEAFAGWQRPPAQTP